ncbi:MAG: SDR family NAD(P)-dependent oxidoreductase, partial [Longimicrobiales bacterium]
MPADGGFLDDELRGQVALVTGASRGIGRSIAEHLARGGARVVIAARALDRAEAAAAALPGDGHHGFACDVADAAAVDALIKAVESELSGLDILVNNAGV